jgi:tRNA pseudouridine38-40 synthase
LRHMVRNIVGTLVRVGRGRMDPDGFGHILEARNRQAAGEKSPPQGLFLTGIQY